MKVKQIEQGVEKSAVSILNPPHKSYWRLPPLSFCPAAKFAEVLLQHLLWTVLCKFQVGRYRDKLHVEASSQEGKSIPTSDQKRFWRSQKFGPGADRPRRSCEQHPTWLWGSKLSFPEPRQQQQLQLPNQRESIQWMSNFTLERSNVRGSQNVARLCTQVANYVMKRYEKHEGGNSVHRILAQKVSIRPLRFRLQRATLSSRWSHVFHRFIACADVVCEAFLVNWPLGQRSSVALLLRLTQSEPTNIFNKHGGS